MSSMNIFERILVYADLLYQKAMGALNDGRYRRGEITASAAAGAAVFLIADTETPPEIKARALTLEKAAESLIGNLRKLQMDEYGETFLSGGSSGKDPSREVGLFIDELRDAAREARDIASR